MQLASRVLLAFAAPMGAAGVIFAAMATHLAGGPYLTTASLFLLMHAAALLGLSALLPQVTRGRAAMLVGAGLLILGTALFSFDLVARALMGVKLLWGTAPTGGTLMIFGWLGTAVPLLFPSKKG